MKKYAHKSPQTCQHPNIIKIHHLTLKHIEPYQPILYCKAMLSYYSLPSLYFLLICLHVLASFSGVSTCYVALYIFNDMILGTKATSSRTFEELAHFVYIYNLVNKKVTHMKSQHVHKANSDLVQQIAYSQILLFTVAALRCKMAQRFSKIILRVGD